MRILQVIQYLASSYGGPATVCKDLSKALAKEGHEVVVYSTNLDYPRGYLDVKTDYPYLQDGYEIWYFKGSQGYGFSFSLLNKLIQTMSSFDIVEIHGLYRFPQAIAAYVARLTNSPYVIRPHGSLDPFLYYQSRNYWIKRLYERLVDFPNINSASALHFTAEDEYQLIKPLKLKPIPWVIPLGLNVTDYSFPNKGDFKHKLGLNREEKIILYLGRLHFKKGIDILIESFSLLSNERNDVKLVIAGPDNDGYIKVVKEWISKAGIQDKVIFTGLIEGNDKFSAFQDADVFLLPSYSENFGITIVEAMLFESPVVISNKVNIWREIQDAGAGIVTNCNAYEVKSAMVKILGDSVFANTMGIAAKQLVLDRYNWEIIVPQLTRSYNSIIR